VKDGTENPVSREIQLRNGTTIHVSLGGETILVVAAGRWKQELSREEAWELSEALDDVATRRAAWDAEERESDGDDVLDER
jgi:antitoxin component of MazEF toxin-antitoxin module